jgi:hypothetical protein
MSSVVISGDTSGAITVSAPAVSGTNTLTLQAATATSAVNTLSTAITLTTQTAPDFTSIPSWVKKITFMFAGISTNSTGVIQVQLGTSSGYEITGYATSTWTANTSNVAFTTGFAIRTTIAAAFTQSGHLTLTTAGSNLWIGSGVSCRTDAADSSVFSGNKTLGGTLDRLRIIASATGSPSDTFDAGTINVLLEG